MITVSALHWPRAKVTIQMQRRARKMWEDGWTLRRIGGEIGVDATTVRMWSKAWTNERGTASGAPEPGPVPAARRDSRL